jgi:hypothetical protein
MFSILQSIQMLQRNSIIRLFAIISIIALSSTSIAFAQNETGQRPCNPAALKFSRVWYPNYSMYQMKYPILRSVPPIETGMPLNILFSYIYMDSLLRTAKPHDFRKRLVQWQTMNDTLRYMVQALNTLKDYDPIRYNQYRIETLLQIKRSGGMRLDPPVTDSALLAENTPVHYPERYESTVFATEGSILTRFQRTYAGTDYEAMNDALCSDYVLRATVISIDSMPSKYHLDEPQRGIFEYRVTIAVTDTLKGKVLKPLDVSTLNIPSKPKNRTADGTQYYQFQYSTSHKSHDGYISPLLTDQSGRFIITPGQDLIIFLGFYNLLLDCEYDYYDLTLQQQCKSFILPVMNNTVIDGGHIWSDSDSMSYPAWKEKFNTIMQKFSTRNF